MGLISGPKAYEAYESTGAGRCCRRRRSAGAPPPGSPASVLSGGKEKFQDYLCREGKKLRNQDKAMMRVSG
uniref:Uncharacterized protein n=1 Tax=Oryza punctata TaxID=4537 RepID=A0A0E0M3U4_ORYPU